LRQQTICPHQKITGCQKCIKIIENIHSKDLLHHALTAYKCSWVTNVVSSKSFCSLTKHDGELKFCSNVAKVCSYRSCSINFSLVSIFLYWFLIHPDRLLFEGNFLTGWGQIVRCPVFIGQRISPNTKKDYSCYLLGYSLEHTHSNMFTTKTIDKGCSASLVYLGLERANKLIIYNHDCDTIIKNEDKLRDMKITEMEWLIWILIKRNIKVRGITYVDFSWGHIRQARMKSQSRNSDVIE